MPVCCTQGQIDPFVGPYFEYVDQFDCIYLRNLCPAYDGVSSHTHLTLAKKFIQMFSKLYCGPVEQFN